MSALPVSRPSRRTVLAAGVTVPLLAGLGVPTASASPGARVVPTAPPLLPAPQRYSPGGPGLPIVAARRIALVGDEADMLRSEAALLARDLRLAGLLDHHLEVLTTARPRRTDIVLEVADLPEVPHPEGYVLSTGHGIRISAPSRAGVFSGTRTLLQLLRSGGRPGGVVVDWPELDERALMLDIGRKYFSPDWIKALISEMAYLKMNTLQLHISEGLGFGVESETHPEIASPQHLTKAEVRDILDFARAHHVRVHPDVDSPGHMDHILAFHPEHQLVLRDGTRHPGYLDISRPGARALVREIVEEMCELFDGTVFHLGGDEYFPAPWQGTGPDVISDESAPQLVDYARQVTGNPAATALDAYEAYLNELAGLVRAHGFTPRVWNDDIRPGEGVSRIDPRTQADVWIRWNTSKPTAADYAAAGHDLINSNGDYLYFILTSEGLGQGPYKNPRGIYERWTPRTFMGAAGSAGDFELPAGTPVVGAHLSVWCDSPDAMTQEEVAEQLQEWLQVFAQQVWGSPRPVESLAELRSVVLSAVGTAPA
ncbi:glycoside hydrolase family 20 protein [Isoptericola sp. NPDC057559]|uniref:beta-N-acetylhexosaminidase n=1 Tax=Isoptericola sp. NPDC057559 TaxID=3346168 RepID=UPI0036CCF413